MSSVLTHRVARTRGALQRARCAGSGARCRCSGQGNSSIIIIAIIIIGIIIIAIIDAVIVLVVAVLVIVVVCITMIWHQQGSSPRRFSPVALLSLQTRYVPSYSWL